MKSRHIFGRALGIALLFSLTSCVNSIPEEEKPVNNVEVPVKFTAAIQSGTTTRVSANCFEVGDEVGLFALLGSTTLQEERYADNLHFVKSPEGEFVTDKTIYYPEDGINLKLISYYPYQENGITMGESTMQVSVKPNQSTLADYSSSDFLVASQDNVSATKETVELTYRHQFFRLKIVLKPGEGEDVQKMLEVDPKISFYGFYTKAVYDFQQNTCTDYSDEEKITPRGEWQIDTGKLVGKEVILIPQQLTNGYQYVTLEADGKVYTTFLPSTLEMQSGKQRELQITFVSDEDILMTTANGEIADWEGADIDNAESETMHKYIDVSKLTFDQSNVYKVLHNGQQVAEICKEYLVSSRVSSQAVVAYPMKAGGGADLSKGIVMQLVGQTGKVHGGAVSWDLNNNTLSYTPGIMVAQSYLYVMADGRVALSVSPQDDVLSVFPLKDVMRDARGSTIRNYPIVKIGIQYWMQCDLEASLYIDGTEIPRLTQMEENSTGYVQSVAGNYFYSASTLLTHKLLPAGWGVPNWNDWNLLKTYLKEDASVLKSGTWRLIENNSFLGAATNLSGFNAKPVGMCWGTYDITSYEGRYLGYWTLSDTGDSVGQVLLLKSSSNEITGGNVAVDKAYTIRALRK